MIPNIVFIHLIFLYPQLGAKVSIPLDYAWNGSLRMKPHDLNYSYSEEKILCSAVNEVGFITHILL